MSFWGSLLARNLSNSLTNALRKCFLALRVLVGIFLLGCQSSPLKSFDSVKIGMEKSEVIEIVGSPTYNQRFHGKDRWAYVFYDSKTRYEKEIQFEQGKAIYVGEPWVPAPENSAKVADEKNELANKALEEQQIKQFNDNKKSNFSDYEADVKGTKKIKYVPIFVPINN